MEEKKIRIGLIGTSYRCHSLSESYHLHPQYEVVAGCDTAEHKAANFAETYKNITGGKTFKPYSSYEEMLKNEAVDAVLIATDPDVQVDIAVDAMNRGIHVMTEVPAAFSIAQCERLVDTVEKTGCKYQMQEQTRYWKFIQDWRKMAQSGELGHIIFADGEYLHYEPQWDSFKDRKTGHTLWSNDPTYYANLDYTRSWRGTLWRNPIFYLPHTLSPLLSITGGRITKVSCMGVKPMSYGTPGMEGRDIQNALMYNDQDTVFSVRAGFTSPYGPKAGTGAHWYQLKGTKKSVEWARSTLDGAKMYDAETKEWTSPSWSCEDPDAPEFIREGYHGGADYYPLMHFIDAINNDTTPPMDVYKAVETAAPAILAAQSCEQGGTLLEVPDFRNRNKK